MRIELPKTSTFTGRGVVWVEVRFASTRLQSEFHRWLASSDTLRIVNVGGSGPGYYSGAFSRGDYRKIKQWCFDHGVEEGA